MAVCLHSISIVDFLLKTGNLVLPRAVFGTACAGAWGRGGGEAVRDGLFTGRFQGPGATESVHGAELGLGES